MSTSLSRAMRLTSGDERCLRESSSAGLLAVRPLVLRGVDAGFGSGVSSRGTTESSEGAAAGGALPNGSCCEVSDAAPIVATTLFTATVSPSLTLISVRTPVAGAGISASTLSVEISKSGSSRSTASPTFLIHLTMVPSAIDSPIWGIRTGVGMELFQVRLTAFASGLRRSRSGHYGLHMYGRAVGCVRCFADGFGEGRVSVNRLDQLFDGALEPECQHRFGHQLRRAGSNHVHTQ